MTFERSRTHSNPHIRLAPVSAGPTSRDFDVVVIGASTAGLATAVALLQDPSLRVAIVARRGSTRIHAAERLGDDGRAVLQRLNLWRLFLAEHHVRTLQRRGSSTVSNQTFIYHPGNSGWAVDRRWFDELLASEATRRGGTLLTRCDLIVGASANELTLIPSDGPPLSVNSRFVVDATGARAIYARRRGARRKVVDRLAGVTVRFAIDEPYTPPKVETCSEGWWHSDQRPGGLLVSCMTDPRRVGRLGLKSLDGFWALLEQTDFTRRRVRGAWAQSTPVVHAASYHRLEPIVGDDWLAVDEAVFGPHPLLGDGLRRALLCADQASAAIRHHLAGRRGLGEYGHRAAGEHHRHVRALAGYYAGEQARWPNRDFWRQRRDLY